MNARLISQKTLKDATVPVVFFIVALSVWQATVQLNHIPPYIMPAPTVIFYKLIEDRGLLFSSLLITLSVTLKALILATLCGAGLALILSQSRLLERALLPFAIILQVTPIIAIAPLLLVYLDASKAVLVCAFLVAFFPILSNTSLGLASVDLRLQELFELYKASAWQKLVYLRIPAALPYFLTGLRIGGGLSLIGAIVAELAAGASGQGTGLAFRIVEAGFRLDVPRMFAALTLISMSGLSIYGLLALLTHYLLRRWHESARRDHRD